MISALDALERLREGNRRFARGDRHFGAIIDESRRGELVGGQEPLAIVLGCSDSRVPVEMVFDGGLGDLFVIRVAGNVVASSQVRSIEFAAERFGTRLVVVLGHSSCGAVQATLEELDRPAAGGSPELCSITDRIRPSVEPLLAAGDVQDRDALLARAVRANISASAEQLRHGSAIIEGLIASDGLLVVGAEYSLVTGEVDFFDGVG